MSFDKNSLAQIGGTSPAPVIYTYITSDSKTVVTGIGYFNAGFTTFSVDDIIKVLNNDGEFDLRVIASGKSNIVVQLIVVSQEAVPTTAYGEVPSESLSPITQIKATSGLLNNVLTVADSGSSGTNTVASNKFTCQTGVASDGLASILTLRQLTTRAGQGALARFSAIFDTGVVDANQVAGLITAENLFTFGYIGTNFGIIAARDGVDELQELTLTVAGGAENATVTIDGIGFTVALSGGGTVQIDAYEIALSLSAQVPNYNFTSNNDQVVAQSIISQPGGSFAYSSAGTSVGSWAQIAAGNTGDTTFIPQSSWNFDTRLTGDSNSILDPQTNNYYKIQLNGSVDFFIEDRATKRSILVHRMQFTNADTLSNPSEATFRVGWLVRNVGNTTSVTIQGTYAACFVEGHIFYDTAPQGVSASQTVTAAAGLRSVIILRNRISFGDRVNRTEVLPLVTAATSQTSKFAFIKLLLNPTFASPVNFQYRDKASSVVEIANDDVLVTGGLVIGSATVEAGAGALLQFNLTNNRTTAVFPGSTICVAAEIPSSGGTGDCQADLTFQEDL